MFRKKSKFQISAVEVGIEVGDNPVIMIGQGATIAEAVSQLVLALEQRGEGKFSEDYLGEVLEEARGVSGLI